MLSILQATIIAFVGLALVPMLARAQGTLSVPPQSVTIDHASTHPIEQAIAGSLLRSGS